MVETGREGTRLVGLLPPTRDGDERYRAAEGALAHSARDFVAVELGHSDVEQGDLGVQIVEGRQRLLPVMHDPDFVTLEPQQHRQAFGGVSIVVRYQHAA